MALERVPADIRAQGGVSRMSDPDMIDGIIETVSIPVMAKARMGHLAEAIVKATTFFDDPDVVAKVSGGLGEAMVGINVDEIPQPRRLSERGW